MRGVGDDLLWALSPVESDDAIPEGSGSLFAGLFEDVAIFAIPDPFFFLLTTKKQYDIIILEVLIGKLSSDGPSVEFSAAVLPFVLDSIM